MAITDGFEPNRKAAARSTVIVADSQQPAVSRPGKPLAEARRRRSSYSSAPSVAPQSPRGLPNDDLEERARRSAALLDRRACEAFRQIGGYDFSLSAARSVVLHSGRWLSPIHADGRSRFLETRNVRPASPHLPERLKTGQEIRPTGRQNGFRAYGSLGNEQVNVGRDVGGKTSPVGGNSIPKRAAKVAATHFDHAKLPTRSLISRASSVVSVSTSPDGRRSIVVFTET